MKKESYEDVTLFNQRIRELCKERNITLADLAKRMGIKTTGLSVAGGHYSPSYNNIKAYTNALNVPVWETLHDCGESAVANNSIQTSTITITCPHCLSTFIVNVNVVGLNANLLKYDSNESEDTIPITERIKNILKEKDIKVSDLSTKIGMGRTGLSANLRSENLSLATLSRIAKGIGIETWRLFADESEVEKTKAVRSALKANNRVKKLIATVVCPNCAGETEVSM